MEIEELDQRVWDISYWKNILTSNITLYGFAFDQVYLCEYLTFENWDENMK